jgi:hypothetical protein
MKHGIPTARFNRGLLYGGGGKFKNTTGRGFRSFLSFPPPPKPLPLGFHRAHVSLPDNSKLSDFHGRGFNLCSACDALANQH